MVTDYVNLDQLQRLSDDPEGNFWDKIMESEIVKDISGTVVKEGSEAAKNEITKIFNGNSGGDIAPAGSTGGVVPGGGGYTTTRAGTMTTTTAEPAQQSKGINVDAIVQKIKSIHPAFIAFGVGAVTKYVSKSWLGAGLAAAGAYFLVDRI